MSTTALVFTLLLVLVVGIGASAVSLLIGLGLAGWGRLQTPAKSAPVRRIELQQAVARASVERSRFVGVPTISGPPLPLNRWSINQLEDWLTQHDELLERS